MSDFSQTPMDLLSQLERPSPSTCRSERVDFEKLGLPEYKDKFAVLIHNLFSAEECKNLLDAAEQTAENRWESAMVNVGAGQQRMMTDIRLCGRIIWDTADVGDRLLGRIKPHLPDDIVFLKASPGITGPGPAKRQETWELTRLNERLRFLRYRKGMYFREHCDGSYVTPDGSGMSFLTVHLYLNSADAAASKALDNIEDHEKPLKGGATRFFGWNNKWHDVNPEVGACLVFQHRGLYHSGEEVEQGTKYTVRTDIMYRKVNDSR